MSERYVIKDRWIFDTKLNKNIHSIDCYEEKHILDIMNSQNERIAELEEQLKNAIVPIIEFLNDKKKKKVIQAFGNVVGMTVNNIKKLDTRVYFLREEE